MAEASNTIDSKENIEDALMDFEFAPIVAILRVPNKMVKNRLFEQLSYLVEGSSLARKIKIIEPAPFAPFQ